MKGYVQSLAVLIVLTMCTACLARDPHNPPSVSESELSLGGIHIGMSYQEVTAMYGVPEWRRGDSGTGVAMYGKDIRIGFENESVVYVFTRSNNGWTTPSGLSVGMKLNDAFTLYGEGDLLGKGYLGEYYRWFGGRRGVLYIASDYGHYGTIGYIEVKANLQNMKTNVFEAEHFE